MRYVNRTLCMALTLSIAACTTDKKMISPPLAEKHPTNVGLHGDQRIDEYYWMNAYFKKTADSNKVIKYLEDENAYTKEVLSDIRGLRDTLFSEMKARIKEEDQTAPVFNNGYYYYNRYEKGSQYPYICRRKGSIQAAEEVILDVNNMSQGHPYFESETYAVSPDNKLVAYAVDTLSRRQFTIYIKNLETGETLKDALFPCSKSIAWANDSKTIFYIENDPETLLGEKVRAHVCGTDASTDRIVYEEADHENYLSIERSRSGKLIMIGSKSTMSAEVRYVNADRPASETVIIQPRIKDVLYDVDEQNGRFLILTNLQAKNFRLMETPVENSGVENWKELIPHSTDVLLEDITAFKDFYVVSERKNGLTQLRVHNNRSNSDHYLDFGEPAYAAEVGDNEEYNTNTLRYEYTSLTTPHSDYDYDMQTREKNLVKRQEVAGGYNIEEYVTERFYATATDGAKIPVSIVYKKGFQRDGSAPLLLYGYGSYGHSTDASFSGSRLSLLDRGFAYAIAHVRGGQEMGRHWYEDGKMLSKKNTFTDFIAAAEFLIKEKFTSPAHLYAYGGSAGGLLMGAVVNMRPELWNGVVAEVPFVDVVTTMMDESIPLTTNEYDEWGNPKEKKYYDYMKSYSPYDNVEAKEYPNLLVMTGLHDSQVQYFEPAKWVARMRERKKGDKLLLLSTNMDYGHGGASGRFDYLNDIALMCGFYLMLERQQQKSINF